MILTCRTCPLRRSRCMRRRRSRPLRCAAWQSTCRCRRLRPSREAAVELLNSAVRARLAAGGQVSGPVVTAFWHRGELGNGGEWTVVLKTTTERYPELEAHLIEAHPWDNPEVSFTPLGGSAAYLDWVSRTTT